MAVVVVELWLLVVLVLGVGLFVSVVVIVVALLGVVLELVDTVELDTGVGLKNEVMHRSAVE